MIAAIAMIIMHYGFGFVYIDENMSKHIIWLQIILTLFSIFVIKKFSTWKKSGFDKLDLKGFLWILPSFIFMGAYLVIMALNFKGTLSQASIDVATSTAILLLFVGFAEETMFRGILLNWSLEKYGKNKAIFISSIGFALLHVANILGGEPLGAVWSQVFDTFLNGVFMAIIVLKMKNIIPAMILHFLWDFTILFTNTLVEAGNLPTNLTQYLIGEYVYEKLIAAVYFIYLLWKFYKKRRK